MPDSFWMASDTFLKFYLGIIVISLNLQST